MRAESRVASLAAGDQEAEVSEELAERMGSRKQKEEEPGASKDCR